MKTTAFLRRALLAGTILIATSLCVDAAQAPKDSIKAEIEATLQDVGEKISKIALTQVATAIDSSTIFTEDDSVHATYRAGNTTIIINQKTQEQPFATTTRIKDDKAKVIAVGVIVPCATIIIIVLALLIFLLVRGYNRNKIISEAIRNNYQLPDSFYTGTNSRSTPDYADNIDSRSAEPAAEETKLPPLPRVPFTLAEKDYLSKSMILAGVGLMIFLFFLWCGAIGVGLLAGGIPFVIGAARVAVFYINRR